MGEPGRQGGKKIGSRGGESALGTLDEHIDIEPGGDWISVDPLDGLGDAFGNFGGELPQVAQDGRKTKSKEEAERQKGGGDEESDGDAARGAMAAKFKLCDANDYRAEDDGE